MLVLKSSVFLLSSAFHWFKNALQRHYRHFIGTGPVCEHGKDFGPITEQINSPPTAPSRVQKLDALRDLSNFLHFQNKSTFGFFDFDQNSRLVGIMFYSLAIRLLFTVYNIRTDASGRSRDDVRAALIVNRSFDDDKFNF